MANTIENEGNKDQFLLSTNLPYNHKTNDNHHHQAPHHLSTSNNHLSDNLKTPNSVEFKKDLDNKNGEVLSEHHQSLHVSQAGPLDETENKSAQQNVKYGFLNSYYSGPMAPYGSSCIHYPSSSSGATAHSNNQQFLNYSEQKSTDHSIGNYQASTNNNLNFNDTFQSTSSNDFSNTNRIFTDASNSLNSAIYSNNAMNNKLLPSSPVSSNPVSWSNSLSTHPGAFGAPVNNSQAPMISSGFANVKYNNNLENTNYPYQNMGYQNQQVFRNSMNFYPPNASSSYIQDQYYAPSGLVSEKDNVSSMMSYQSSFNPATNGMTTPASQLDFKFVSGGGAHNDSEFHSGKDVKKRANEKVNQSRDTKNRLSASLESEYKTSSDVEDESDEEDEEEDSDEDGDDDENSSGSDVRNDKKASGKGHINAPWMHSGNYLTNIQPKRILFTLCQFWFKQSLSQ
jgi:hypothetical protein